MTLPLKLISFHMWAAK